MCTGKTTLQNLPLYSNSRNLPTHSTLQHPQLTQNLKNGIQHNPCNIHIWFIYFFFLTFPSVTKLKGDETSLKRVFSTPKNCLWTPYCFQNRFQKRRSGQSVSDLCLFFRFFLLPFSLLFLVFTIDFNLLFLPPRLILFSCLLPPNWNRKCVGFCLKEREKFFPCFSGVFLFLLIPSVVWRTVTFWQIKSLLVGTCERNNC
jgi:hypothetical protein